jgi:uncharacterized RDD family membrane protein YckC
MKCPKCDYLGFETGDRCKNCGYDFSLLAEPAATVEADPDLSLRDFDHQPVPDHWLNELDQTMSPGAERVEQRAAARSEFFDISFTPESIEPAVAAAPEPPDDLDLPMQLGEQADPDPVIEDEPEPAFEEALPIVPVAAPPRMTLIEKPVDTYVPSAPAASAAAAKRAEPALPLFMPAGDEDDDAPLIKLPAAPRAPLSVRRTPDTPRLRAVPKLAPRLQPEPEPALAFTSESVTADEEPADNEAIADVRAASRVWRGPASSGAAGSAARRLTAAVIDHAILLSIDLVVVYFTLRMVALDMNDWALLPRAPLALFLVLIKFAYFCAFTAIGGQTIGKMATRIRVVTDEEGELDGAQAARRTLVGVLSAITFGLGFLPGLVGDRRALHDRAAHTRVVGLESA